MPEARNSYSPDYAIHPGEYLEEVLESRGISKTEFAARCGISLKTVSQIIHGKASFSPDVALQFQNVLGVSAEIWLRLQSSYQLHESRAEEASRLGDAEEWARKFPLGDMKKLGIVSPGKDWTGKVREILMFFNVSSPEAWESYYAAKAVAYRKSPTLEASRHSIATWLRIAELAAERFVARPYDKAVLSEALIRIRSLTTKPPEEFEKELCGECAAAGVALVFVPELHATRISGAAKWLTGDKAMIALSLRHKSDDHFWFTLFHELGHIFLHGRKAVFIDSDSDKRLVAEKEADAFARRVLIPAQAYEAFVSRGVFYGSQIEAFAKESGVSPGIVVGMLQHDRHIPYSWHNNFKVRYGFGECSS